MLTDLLNNYFDISLSIVAVLGSLMAFPFPPKDERTPVRDYDY